MEVLGAPSFVIAGNSIGGGLASGVACNLKVGSLSSIAVPFSNRSTSSFAMPHFLTSLRQSSNSQFIFPIRTCLRVPAQTFCRGLVLCNTAGNILGNSEEEDQAIDRTAALSMTSRTLQGGGATLGQYYAPPPLPPWLLNAFGN